MINQYFRFSRDELTVRWISIATGIIIGKGLATDLMSSGLVSWNKQYSDTNKQYQQNKQYLLIYQQNNNNHCK